VEQSGRKTAETTDSSRCDREAKSFGSGVKDQQRSRKEREGGGILGKRLVGEGGEAFFGVGTALLHKIYSIESRDEEGQTPGLKVRGIVTNTGGGGNSRKW